MKPLETYLNTLIDEAPEGVAQVQVMFRPGVQNQAGGVRRHPEIDGLYEFCTPTQAAADMERPDGTLIRQGESVVVSIAFEADALLQVVRPLESSGIIAPPQMGHA